MEILDSDSGLHCPPDSLICYRPLPPILPASMRNRVAVVIVEPVHLHPEGNGNRIPKIQARIVRHANRRTCPVEGISTIGISKTVVHRLRIVDRSVVAIAARIVCISGEWKIRYKGTGRPGGKIPHFQSDSVSCHSSLSVVHCSGNIRSEEHTS